MSNRSAISLALGQIGKDFNLQAADLGIIISAFFLGCAVMQVPGGWLADRFGSQYVIVVAIAMWSVFTVMTSFAWSSASLIMIRVVFGLTEGAFPAASFKGLAELFDGPERPKLAALPPRQIYAGSMAAPLIMAPLIIAMGWRYAFEAIGFAGVAFAVVYVLLVPYVRPAAASGVGPASIGAPAPTGKAGARELLKESFLWQLLTVWFGVSCVNKGPDSSIPIYLLQQRGLDLKAVGILTRSRSCWPQSLPPSAVGS
jgi:MFS family permease